MRDGEPAYCYNSDVATMRISAWDTAWGGRFPSLLRGTLVAGRRARFEYAQRQPVDGLPLHVT